MHELTVGGFRDTISPYNAGVPVEILSELDADDRWGWIPVRVEM